MPCFLTRSLGTEQQWLRTPSSPPGHWDCPRPWQSCSASPSSCAQLCPAAPVGQLQGYSRSWSQDWAGLGGGQGWTAEPRHGDRTSGQCPGAGLPGAKAYGGVSALTTEQESPQEGRRLWGDVSSKQRLWGIERKVPWIWAHQKDPRWAGQCCSWWGVLGRGIDVARGKGRTSHLMGLASGPFGQGPQSRAGGT